MRWGFAAASLIAAAAPAANPVFEGADPHAVVIAGELWIFPTGGPGGSWSADRLRAWSSGDGEHWRMRGVLLQRAGISWIGDDKASQHFLWAPAVTRRRDRFFLYYAVGPQNPTPSRIGVATASRPGGPYHDTGKPLLTGGNGFEAIDPMVFVDPATGRAYLYAGGSAGATLRIFELAPDMITISREADVAQPPFFTEGAFMHVRKGIYYLSYSHGHWNGPDYSVHYATASSPTGPWHYRGTILQADANHQGPGHHSFARMPNGEWLIVYHRWERPPGPRPFAGERKIAIDRVVYRADGTIRPIAMTDGAAAPRW